MSPTHSNNSYDCIEPRDFRPSNTTLSTIYACQQAAKTPFCWPPNGSRLCVNDELFDNHEYDIYWPESYYRSNAVLDLVYTNDVVPYFNGPMLMNFMRGNCTRRWANDVYDQWGQDIPGREPRETPREDGEKQLKLYMVERMSENNELGYLAVRGLLYEGPVLTLVKTTSWTEGNSWLPGPDESKGPVFCIVGKNVSCTREDSDGSVYGVERNGSRKLKVGVMLGVLCGAMGAFAAAI